MSDLADIYDVPTADQYDQPSTTMFTSTAGGGYTYDNGDGTSTVISPSGGVQIVNNDTGQVTEKITSGPDVGIISGTDFASSGSGLSGIWDKVKGYFTDPKTGNLDVGKLLGMAGVGAGGLAGLMGARSARNVPKVGFQGQIPKYTFNRTPISGAMNMPIGQGRQYFQSQFEPVTTAAQGGLMGLRQGRYLDGATDGMADKISTSIDGKQPAALSHGEFVIPADVVSHLGNGNSTAGADRLYAMMDRIRKARTGTKKQGREINPDKYLPK